MQTRTRVLIAALGLLLLPGCSERASTAAELHIGLIAPVTGALSGTGNSTLEGAELAVAQVNASGGLQIDGNPVKLVLVVEDNQDSEAAAASAVLKLVNQDNVSAIVGPQASRNAIPAGQAAERAQIPLISPASTHPDTTRNRTWVFRVAFTDIFQGQVMARFTRETLQLNKVGVLFDISSDYNRDLAQVFKSSFEALGGEVVAYEAYTRDAPDVRSQLTRIQGSGAQGLFLPNYYNEVPEQVAQARALGLNLALIGSDSWAQIAPVHRRIIEGAYFSAHFAADIGDERARNFVDQYRLAYSHEPTGVAALTYDAVGLLVRAAQVAGSVEPGAIRDGLATMQRYPGVTGEVTFAGSGDPIKSVMVMQVRDGRFVFHSRVDP